MDNRNARLQLETSAYEDRAADELRQFRSTPPCRWRPGLHLSHINDSEDPSFSFRELIDSGDLLDDVGFGEVADVRDQVEIRRLEPGAVRPHRQHVRLFG